MSQGKGGFKPRPFSLLGVWAAGLLMVIWGCKPSPRDPVVVRNRENKARIAAPQPPSIEGRQPASTPRKLDEILALPDSDFDLSEAVLELGKEINPASNTEDALASLDRLAAAAKDELPLSPDTIDYIDALYNAVLDRKSAEAFREDRPEDYDLAFTLSKRRGTCLSVGILTLSVARRIGAPLHGAQAPGHFLLRSTPFPDGKVIYFDVTRPMPDKWRELDDDFFRRGYKFDEKTRKSAGYLTPLNDKQVLALYLASRAGFFSKRGQYDLALKDAQRAQALDPNNPIAALNAGFSLESLSRWKEAEQQYRRVLQLDPHSVRVMSNLAYLKVRDPESDGFDPREAERIVGQALKLDPSRAYLHATLAEVKAARQDWRAATRSMQEAMRLDKKNAAYRDRFMAFRTHLRDEE